MVVIWSHIHVRIQILDEIAIASHESSVGRPAPGSVVEEFDRWSGAKGNLDEAAWEIPTKTH